MNERKVEFLNAVERLEEVCAGLDTDILRDARIQRFEFTFELAWKTLRSCLQSLGLEANSPRQAFKDAFAQGIIPDVGEADIWLAMLEDRNLTTHTYKSDLAHAIADRIRVNYAPVLRALAEKLRGWNPP